MQEAESRNLWEMFRAKSFQDKLRLNPGTRLERLVPLIPQSTWVFSTRMEGEAQFKLFASTTKIPGSRMGCSHGDSVQGTQVNRDPRYEDPFLHSSSGTPQREVSIEFWDIRESPVQSSAATLET